MNRRVTVIGIVLLAAIGLGLAWIGWQTAHSHRARACDACGRPVHHHSKTEGTIDGKKELFCCPACALTLRRQTGEVVKILELTDYSTSKPIGPSAAFIAYDSNLNLCLREQVLRPKQADAAQLDFDRCIPSMIAFALRAEAESFVAQHGGRVLRFEELEAAFAASAP
jgi:hypothetical protein